MNISLLRSAWPKWVASYDSNLAITPAGLEFGQDYFRQFPDNEPKIIVNVGGGWPTKRYAPEKLNSAINNAVERANITKWHALYGPGEKTDAQQATGTYGLLIPDNNIQEMLGLIAAADIFVSADTGPLHAAAALKTSCLGFFGPTPPSRNGPFNTKSVIVEKHCPLQYCFRRSCKLDFCLQTLPPEKLEEGLLALINDWKNKE
jgi:ADP-heptose:LPS heptosyltransferase